MDTFIDQEIVERKTKETDRRLPSSWHETDVRQVPQPFASKRKIAGTFEAFTP
jgi:hypothetical protein